MRGHRPTWQARAAEALALRAQGLTVREIATELDISISYVSALMSDPSGERAYRRKRQGVCVDCGGACDSSARGHAQRCLTCATRLAKRNRVWPWEDVRAALLEFAEHHGRPPTARDTRGPLRGDLPSLRVAAIRERGGWRAVLIDLGLKDPDDRRGVPASQVVAAQLAETRAEAHPLRVRRHGQREPLAGAVLVARPSRWGNPFRVGVDGDRAECVRLYEAYLDYRPDLVAQLPALRGRRLACYCPLDEPCHADVLARLANRDTPAP